MADAVTTQIIIDGPRDVVMLFTDISDGTGESAVLKVDVSALSPDINGKVCTGVRVDRIWSAIDGMQVRLLWDANTDVPFWILTPGEFDFKFHQFSGIPNNAGAGKTGDILFTTFGHTAGDTYSIMLYMVKIFE